MQASAVYALPTVFQDLKDPQVRLDLCASLQQLDTVIADVFKHIKDRVRAAAPRTPATRCLHVALRSPLTPPPPLPPRPAISPAKPRPALTHAPRWTKSASGSTR